MRSFRRCILVALCPFVGLIGAADQPKFSAAQQEVINAHEARTEASNKRDEAAFSRYVADDCIFSTDAGDLRTKAQLMHHLEKLPTKYDQSVNPRDYLVHVYGDTAVLNLRYTTHEQFTDSDIISEIRATETFIKQDGRWLLIAKYWAKIPTNFRKPVAVDTSIYKDYAGEYEWRPLDNLETISVKDGKLWTQSGKDEPEELLPLGADSFFLRNELGINKFVRETQGSCLQGHSALLRSSCRPGGLIVSQPRRPHSAGRC